MTTQFQYIYLLWLLLLLPLVAAIYFYAKHKKQQTFKKLGDAALVNELTAHYNTTSFFKKFLLVWLALALLIVSIANLRSPSGAQQVNRNGIDVMIALDVSKSMLAQDVKPNRLDRAKQLLSKLIDQLSNDRIGIVVFAGKAYLQMPLTADHAATKMYLSAATPETIPTQGTVIGDALKMCYASFNSKEKKYKAVILITDGEDHDENAVSIAEQMSNEGVVINTVGIGSPDGAPIFDPTTNDNKKDNEGNIVITKLNEVALADIAKKGNGNYTFFTNTDAAVSSIYNQLATLDTKAVKDESLINYKSWFQYLLGIALILLIIEMMVSELKSKKQMTFKPLLLLVFMSSHFITIAQAPVEAIKKGNDAYKTNDFATAINQYNIATQKDDKNAIAQFNLGNALYKSDKKEDALNAYDKASSYLTKPVEKSNALYNKGVVLQNDKKLEDCIRVYKTALFAYPNNVDARHNLQLALKKQKEQQQQQEKDKKDQQNKDNKNNKDNQPQQQKSNLSQKDAEQKLQALQQKEKELQDKLHKVNVAAPNKPEKDW
ncbi:VWA domain-containing protein [Ferruginibacter yonginensis]|uniref:VWA domain-containing protein n=1 Tax=Ferruginibacter yonginensis TaxID=1310416 RepID=A0ABV8QQJ3_9BACT